jgi:acyl-CoA thioesterase I
VLAVEVSFMWPLIPRVIDLEKTSHTKVPSYGNWRELIQSFARLAAVTITCATISLAAGIGSMARAERPIKIVALGDSLTTGLGLAASDAFPAKIARALAAKGLEVEVTDAGVSGDTAAGGLSRLAWSVPERTDAVILELGANDMLHGTDPKLTRAAIEQIVRTLTGRGIAVLICGMRAAPNLGEDYAHAFNGLFAEVAAAYASSNVTYYPFFLDGVAADPKLNQPDGLHPTAAGVDVIVAHILPKVEDLVARVKSRKPQ